MDIAHLRRGFRAQLTKRSEGGFWTYAHQLIGEAVAARYGEHSADPADIHRAVTAHLRRLDRAEAVRASELIHHLLRGDQLSEVCSHFAEDLTAAELAGAVRAIADVIVFQERQVEQPGDGAIRVLESLALESSDFFAQAMYVLRLGTDVEGELEPRLSMLARRRLLEACLDFFTGPRQILTEFEGFAPRIAAIRARLATLLHESGEHSQVHERLAESLEYAKRHAVERPDDPVALGNLAHVYFAEGQTGFNDGTEYVNGGSSIAAGVRSFKQALEIMERVVEIEPEQPLHRSGVSAICSELGRIYLAMGDLDSASHYVGRALAATRAAIAIAPRDMSWQQDLATSLTAMGLVAMRGGEYDKALECQEEALQIRDRIARRDPDDPDNLEALGISHLQTAKVLLSRDGGDDASSERAGDHLRECVRIFDILLAFDQHRTSWMNLRAEAQDLLV